MRIAHRFIYGQERNKFIHKVPPWTNENDGTCKKYSIKNFNRPYGTLMFFLTLFPNNKLLGYYQLSLRDRTNMIHRFIYGNEIINGY